MEKKQLIICDSDVMIDFWNKNNKRHPDTKYIIEEVLGIDNIILSAVTQMELIIGAKNTADLFRINKNIHQFNIALINDKITESAILLLQNYRLSHGLALPDALIAATSLILNIKLFTYNLKDYRFIDELLIFDQAK